MDVTTEVTGNHPFLAIVITFLGIGGTLISGILHAAVKRSLAQSAENAELEKKLVLAQIEKVKTELMFEMQKIISDFALLRNDVKFSLSNTEKVNEAQLKRFADSLKTIQALAARGEKKYSEVLTKLETMHVYVERIKRGG